MKRVAVEQFDGPLMADNDVVFIDVTDGVAMGMYHIKRRRDVARCSDEEGEVSLRKLVTTTPNAVKFAHRVVAGELWHREATDRAGRFESKTLIGHADICLRYLPGTIPFLHDYRNQRAVSGDGDLPLRRQGPC